MPTTVVELAPTSGTREPATVLADDSRLPVVDDAHVHLELRAGLKTVGVECSTVDIDVRHGHVGITLGAVRNVHGKEGVEVIAVSCDDLAARAGLDVGSVIFELNGWRVTDHSRAIDIVNNCTEKLKVSYISGAEAKPITEAAEAKAALKAKWRQIRSAKLSSAVLCCAVLATLAMLAAYIVHRDYARILSPADPDRSGPAFGATFLNSTRSRSGVRSHPSGLLYKVLQNGTGTTCHPNLDSDCVVSYVGRTAANWPDGPAFDSNRRATFKPGLLIQGWQIALHELMCEGDTLEIYVPPQLAYGNTPPTHAIANGDTLVFTLALLQFS